MQKGLSSFATLLVLGLGVGVLRNNQAANGVAPPARPATSAHGFAAKNNSTSASPAKCSQPNCAEDDLLSTIVSSLPDQGADATVAPLIQKFQNLNKGANIYFAIAIVPDPVHTHLSLFFDRTIDSIQQGAQQAGWIFDRATMPWDSLEHPESPDFRIRAQQQADQTSKEYRPGLMIFRRSKPETLNTSLYVFVVGETPTGGINKRQFKTALQLMGSDAKAGKPLRIIGPTFSGSLYSLAQLLVQQSSGGGFGNIAIRSGTVSSWQTADWFKKQKWPGNLSVDFATFQQNDRYMLREFVEFEKDRGYSPDKIAVLAEDETAYGNREFPTSTPSKEWQDKAPADEDSVLQLYFPRDISQLRSAYQQGFEQKASSSSDSYQVRSTLPLNLQDTGSDDDTVQQYAHSQTPLSQESILLGIVTALRDRHIEFIVLQATNPMDTLFLSAFLKKGYSDARVVATPADLLLSRDADDVSLLHGVMSLTTYSLLPDIDEEVAVPASLPRVPRVDHVFPNALAAGTYNATLSQLTCIDWPPALTADPGCTVTPPPDSLPVAGYTEYGWPSLGGAHKPDHPLAPVVWLTVLGRGGFWPVAVLDDGSRKIEGVESSPRPVNTPPKKCSTKCSIWSSCGAYAYDPLFVPPWPVLWGVVCGLVLMMAWLFLLLMRKGSILFAASSAMTLLAHVADPCRSALIAITGWLLLTALLLLGWPWLVWAGLGLLPKVCVAGAGLAILVLCGVCTQELHRRKARLAGKIFPLVALGLVACFVLPDAIHAHSQNSFLYRYIHLTSGASPLLPFLCLLAAGLWWAWFSFCGLALVDKRRPRLPKGPDLPAAGPTDHVASVVTRSSWPSDESTGRLIHVARPAVWDSRVYGPPLTLLAVALFAVDRGHPLLSLETRHFEWIFTIALGLVTFALLCTLFRLLIIWLECGKILSNLDRFPLRRAFAELHYNWEPIWRLGGGKWQDMYRLVSRQLETLEHLRQEVETNEDEDAGELVLNIGETAAEQSKIRVDLADVLKPQGSDVQVAPLVEPMLSDHFIDSYKDLQEKIAKTCAAALKYLQLKWWEEEGLILCEVVSGEDLKDDEDSPKLSLSTRLAERFVALVYLNFMLTVLLRMRTLALAAAGLYICLLLSVNSYPFEPKTALRSLAILMLILVVGMVGYVSAQLHRDSILSLVTRTKPGELGIEFWLRMGSFVALPLISLLVSQFPSLHNALFFWLEPAANALK
jgi:hypothetical protein